MFQKSDRTLLIVRLIVLICILIFAMAIGIVGILVCIDFSILYGLLILFVGALLCWLNWLFWNLLFGFLCDVKLIRNKLYRESNEGLKGMLGDLSRPQGDEARPADEKAEKASAPEKSAPQGGLLSENSIENLLYLKKLYEAGALTREEFEEQKKKLLL